MEELGQALLDFLSSGQSAAGIAILFSSAAVEYIFPPFPGDTVTLFGAFLAATEGWSVPLVFAVVTAGSLAGASLDYALGRRMARTPVEELTGRKRAAREKMQPLLDRFEKHGAAYVAINRFLPGIRALFFVAAGMAELPYGKIMLWGAVSAATWNGLIIGAGFAIGSNWDRLLGLLRTYTTVAWIIVGVLVVILVVRWLVRLRRGYGGSST